MSMVYDFNALTTEALQQFAEELIQKINSDHTFTSEVNFTLEDVEADELTGNLLISISHDDGNFQVARKATWTCGSDDEAYNDPGSNAEYDNRITEDAIKVFKTTSAVIDGYKISLELNDVNELDEADVEVDHISHEDAGIGSYEYWGFKGYDSQPYIQVEGTVIRECVCYLTLIVEPAE